MKYIRITLLWRLLLVFTLLYLIFLTATGFIFWKKKTLSSQGVEQRLHWGLAADIASELQPFLSPRIDYWEVQRKLHDVVRANPGFDPFFIAHDGRVLGDFSQFTQAETEQIAVEPIQRFLSSRKTDELPFFGENPRSIQRIPTVFSAAPLLIGNTPGYLYINLFNQEQERLEELSYIRMLVDSVVPFVLVLTIICTALGYLGVAFVTRPLRRAARTMSNYRRGGAVERLDIRTNDELGDIARAYNSMAESISTHIEELEKRDELRRELVANVSHDLRGPLAVIDGYTSLLRNKEQAPSTEAVREYADIVRRGVTSLSLLLDQLFELAKLDAKEVLPRLEPFSIRDQLDELATEYKHLAVEKLVELTCEYADELPAVLGDRVLLERVMVNLLQNAIRHTDGGGAVTLRATDSGAQVLVEVADTGSGIAEADLPRVFDAHFQSVNQATGKAGAAGLGLAIVRRILEAHGSSIFVSSKENTGSCFSFRLAKANGSSPSAPFQSTGAESVRRDRKDG